MYREQNQHAWNSLAQEQNPFSSVATEEELAHPLLTLDKKGWLPGRVEGMDVLCLAAGGGWQAMLYAAAGARVTVVDLSPGMLDLDRREAAKHGFNVTLIEASMDDLSMLEPASFDIVHQPVSTCYVPKLRPVFQEIARVLRPGGLYISQHKQPTSLQIVDRDSFDRYIIGVSYYHNDPLSNVADNSYRETGTREYLHRWEDLVGELCRAGFVIEDLTEPRRGDPQANPGHFRHRGMFVAPYVRLKARRRSDSPTSPSDAPLIWTP